jgi:hypothetical protein
MVRRVRCAAAVSENLKEPRLEALSFFIPRQRAIQSHERVLHHVLGVVDVPEHRAREAETARIVRVHDRRERVDVAELRAAEYPGIESDGLSGTWQSENW